MQPDVALALVLNPRYAGFFMSKSKSKTKTLKKRKAPPPRQLDAFDFASVCLAAGSGRLDMGTFSEYLDAHRHRPKPPRKPRRKPK